MRMFSIPRKTIVRWISYFRDEFAASREWLGLRGRVDATVGNGTCPVAWLSIFLSIAVQPPAAWWPACNFWLRVRFGEGGFPARRRWGIAGKRGFRV